MEKDKRKKITLELIDTFKNAGNRSLDLRNKGLKKEIKSDNTPVSNGDIEVNNILTNKIENLTPDIPIISEERVDNKEIKNLENFWLIDPIDGTNDYINNRDEFTLNAALIINKKPVIGIIYAPAKKRLFYSYAYSDSYELRKNEIIKLIDLKKKNPHEITAVSYSENLKPEILNFHNKFNVNSFQKVKSSYKFCLVAAGEYDLYIAEPRACEWDIAAGQAIAQNAGSSMTDFEGKEILYGKPNFKNSSIILKNKNIV